VYVLVSKKDKKFELIEVKDLPGTFIYEDSLASMEVKIVDLQLFIVMGFFDGKLFLLTKKKGLSIISLINLISIKELTN
jgi:hypothetical protein